MDITKCSKCLEVISNEFKVISAESETMEVSLFEDMRKSQILPEIASSEESKILCKSCKFWLENFYKKQISEAQKLSSMLDFSIQDCENQLIYLAASQPINKFQIDSESSSLSKTRSKLSRQIEKYTSAIKDLDDDYLSLNQQELDSSYQTFTDYDSYLEQSTRIKVLTSEIGYLSSTNLLFSLFRIGSEGRLGTINGMRLGRLDHLPVPWEEINAAWGHCALLLSTLHRLKSFKSKSINIYPLGACTRLSYRRDDHNRYELYFSEYNFTNLITNFNTAQCLFLEILEEFAEALREQQGMPYPISKGVIGGCSVMFDPIHKEIWCQALRFVLQDLNFLLHKLSS